MKENIKKIGLFAILSGAVSVWVTSLYDSIFGISNGELFGCALFAFLMFIFCSYSYMPEGKKWRRWLLPLVVSSLWGCIFIAFDAVSNRRFYNDAAESLFIQFISLFIVVFVGRIILEGNPIPLKIKNFVDNKKKPLILVWVALLLISAISFFNQSSISEAADSAYRRAEEAYDHADEAYNLASSANDLAEKNERAIRY